jgi:hypothetical protein
VKTYVIDVNMSHTSSCKDSSTTGVCENICD